MFGERERIAEDAAISALITDWERGARKAMDRLFAVQDYAWVTLALGGRGWVSCCSDGVGECLSAVGAFCKGMKIDASTGGEGKGVCLYKVGDGRRCLLVGGLEMT